MSKSVSILFMIIFLSCNANSNQQKNTTMVEDITENISGEKLDTATFGAGCFWCVEAIFQQIKGVKSVKSGYTGGHIKNPSYKEVCSGTTGHAEVAQIIFNPDTVSFTKLLEVFFQTHDPTTLNKQGADVGTQYRSAIFYHSQEQKETAENVIEKLTDENIFGKPIVTEVTKIGDFYPAEDYHQDYYYNNSEQGYCRIVITPKLEKFKKVFSDLVKD